MLIRGFTRRVCTYPMKTRLHLPLVMPGTSKRKQTRLANLGEYAHLPKKRQKTINVSGEKGLPKETGERSSKENVRLVEII